ncbi:hypothetical protein MHU86_4419 [Fragilaria crotonensis]|nr:hypothetical protein MHU86_4419 [Fragilaria crotonensis]
MNRVAFFSLLIATIVLCVCGRKDRNVPHGHFGILKAHAPGPFEVELQASDEQVLSAGKSVMKQVMPKPGETDSAGGVSAFKTLKPQGKPFGTKYWEWMSMKRRLPRS